MKNNDIRDIAIGIVIVIVLFAAGSVSPLFGSLCAFCIPLPVIFYRVKIGRTAGIIITVVSFIVILAMVRGFRYDLIFTIQLILMGLTLGESFAQKFSVNFAFLSALVVSVIAMVLWVFAASLNAAQSPGVMLNGLLDANIAMTMDFYRSQGGMSTQDIAALEAMFTTVKPWVIKFLPAGAVLTYMFTIWANILLSRTLLKRAKLPWPYDSFQSWSVPSNLIFAAFAAGLVWFLAPKGSDLWLIGLSILLIIMPVYCFQGLAILTYGFEKMNAPKPLQILAFVIIIIIWPLVIVVTMLSFFDMWFNFRKLNDKTA